jgi:hypothetical protein
MDYRREAVEAIPKGYYVLSKSDRLKPSDLLWSWCSKEWLRADSPDWLIPTDYDMENVVCAIRQTQMSMFAESVTARRNYQIK